VTSTDADRLHEARQALLRQRLRGVPRAGAVPPVTRRRAAESAPLSLCQRQLWYLNQLAPDSAAYNELVTIRKTGPLDTDALRRAFTEIVRRHEMWRTTFQVIDGEPRQVVNAPPSFDLPVLDLTDQTFAEAERAAVELAAGDTRRPYDLAAGPLLRPRLVRLAPEHHRLYLGLHHLVFDGVSLYRVVLPELVTLYNAYAAGLPSPLAEPPIQYGDYAVWELEAAQQPAVAARVQRWRERLSGVAPLELPLDHARPARQRFRGGMVALHIAPSTVTRLRAIGSRQGASLFQVLAAAYAWWLHSYTGQEDVVFATANDLRGRPELASLVGYCLTPVVLRVDVSDGPTFLQLIDRMRGEVADALDNALPFEQLLRELDVPRDPRRNPVFQAMLVLEPPILTTDPSWSLHQMETAVGDAIGHAKFDLNVELDERPEGHIAGRLIFDADLFERGTAEVMGRHWTRLLEVLADAFDAPLAALELLDAQDRQRHLLEWSSPLVSSAPERCIHEVILAQVARTPEAVAVVANDAQLTYRELADRAAGVAQQLVALGAGPGAVVATVLDRTVDLAVGLLGVLMSGAAYLPIDPTQPKQRATFMLADAEADVLLTRTALLSRLPDADLPVLKIDDVAALDFNHVQRTRTAPHDPAYIIYTSGSTGRPKGVIVEHRGVSHIVTSAFRRFGVSPSDNVVTVASYTFDASVEDIFGSLALGATLVIAAERQVADLHALIALLENSKATLLHATPTTWSALVSAGWSGGSHLTAVSGGEPLTESLAAALIERSASVWNAYGPTEATITALCGEVHPNEPITVGRPLDDVAVYVVGGQYQLLPTGIPGEIVLGGPGVARGYLNRPEQTATRFIDDPFHPGQRVYRTGDRGRVLLDGRVQLLGRLDAQVKVRGFRIEPAEIEATLGRHPAVSECVVVARDDPQGGRRLVAYAVAESVQDTALRAWARSRLPDYMVPQTIVHLPALPVMLSGKVDRSALPAVGLRPAPVSSRQLARTTTERRMAVLWSSLLNVEVTDVTANFFDLGGHSLLAARLIDGLRESFGASVSLIEFLESDVTVAGLAARIEGVVDPTSTPSGRPVTPLFFVYPDMNSAVSARHLIRAWGAERPIYPLIPGQPGGQFDRSGGVEGLVRPLLAEIRQVQPSGPYLLAGFSLGGLLTYDIARQLAEAGHQVDWTGVVDCPTPRVAGALYEEVPVTLRQRYRRLRGRSRAERRAKYREVLMRTVRGGPQAFRSVEAFDYLGALDISRRYARSYPGIVHLFATAGSAEEVDDPSLGWAEFHPGPLDVCELAGDHWTVLDQPQIDDVAKAMRKSLDDAHSRMPMPAAECPSGSPAS